MQSHFNSVPLNYYLASLQLLLSSKQVYLHKLGNKAANFEQARAHAGSSVGLWQAESTAMLGSEILKASRYFAGLACKMAHEPIRCDVGNMRRLRVTKGICLPSDFPIHIICGSKDVIHSWAIPGLGIKIDCVPGYNSHRRILLR